MTALSFIESNGIKYRVTTGLTVIPKAVYPANHKIILWAKQPFKIIKRLVYPFPGFLPFCTIHVHLLTSGLAACCGFVISDSFLHEYFFFFSCTPAAFHSVFFPILNIKNVKFRNWDSPFLHIHWSKS